MRETVESLEKNVETFVSNRRAEGAQLLNQIEQDRAASKSAQAALEQERLRGLMERMSMEPPPTSPQKQPSSSRPTPAALSFSPSNMYPKQNFAGQYQVPSSPPPTSQAHGQQPYTQRTSQPGFNTMSYDPSSLGRIPGPASPPANLTSFNLGRGPASPPASQSTFNIGRGATSPPPNQTSFGRPYSTYGNPAAPPVQSPQQQQPGYVPPGFVPPPPPPGPPPLGPQQTVHYNSTDYYAPAGNGHRTGSAQGQAGDPWAGLSAWK